jgi:AcrR family transcriptional regulator
MPRPARQPVARRPSRTVAGGDDQAARAPRRTQRERLLDAMIELSAETGYQAVSIAQVSSRARVSSATFYELFEGKDDCFIAAYRLVGERVLAQMEPVQPLALSSDEEWWTAARAALGRLLGAVRGDPLGGRVLYIESMADSSEIFEQRSHVLEHFEERAERFLNSTPAGGSLLDLPTLALVGAVRAIVSRHLRTHAEDDLPGLADDLVAWVYAYAVPRTCERWSTGRRAELASAAVPARSSGALAPATRKLPRGRHGLPAGVVARSQRTRIIYATAEVMMSKGYANATVADIVAAAGVARDVFYEHFTDKHHAFLEAQQHPTQHILDTCASAYFAAGSWPQRIWAGLRTLTELIVENPALSHLRLVECYAAGPEAIRRAEEITRSFTIFLEEGYRYRPQAEALPRLCSQAIAGAIFEIVRRHIARDGGSRLAAHLPQMTYIAIAPFTGAVEAIGLVEELRALSDVGASV